MARHAETSGWPLRAHGSKPKNEEKDDSDYIDKYDYSRQFSAVEVIRSNYKVGHAHYDASNQAQCRQRKQIHVVHGPGTKSILYNQWERPIRSKKQKSQWARVKNEFLQEKRGIINEQNLHDGDQMC